MQYKNTCTVELGGRVWDLSFSMETFLDFKKHCEDNSIDLNVFDTKDDIEQLKNTKLMLVIYTYYSILELNRFVKQNLPENFNILVVKSWIENAELKTQQELSDAMVAGVYSWINKANEKKNEIQNLKKKKLPVKK